MHTRFHQIKIILLTLAGSFLMASCAKKDNTYPVSSPDNNIRLAFSLNEEKPQYSILYKNDTIVLPSQLGIRIEGDIDPQSTFRIKTVRGESKDETWEPAWGIHQTYRNHYNEMTVTLQKTTKPNLQLQLQFRVYNDGVAFRYLFPEQPDLSDFIVTEEATQIRFTGNHTCFMHPSAHHRHYENTWEAATLSKIGSDQLVGPPLLVEAENCWLSVLEADLTNYSGFMLSGDPRGVNSLVTKLAPSKESKKVEVSASTPHQSSWRTIMIGEHAGNFIESALVYNLNDPGKLKDVSWIKPGKVAWPWWSGRVAAGQPFSGAPSTRLMNYYTDFAARNNIPYLLVDAGWYCTGKEAWTEPAKEDVLTMEETRSDIYDIQEVIHYATQQGVDVLLWIHMGSILTKEEVDRVLPTLAQWGAKGIKVDYFGGEYQELVNHFHYILKVAAEHNLVVNYHGAYKPTGVHRTYPHFMTSEAIKGLEFSKGHKEPVPKHNVIAPYTRMLCGPMDYTPGAFDLDGTKNRPKHVQTTRAHQMAMYPVYFSPLQMLVDYPQAYENAPEQFEFLKQVPVTWDETKFLKGYPGEYIAVARRKGNDWFVGTMNNETSGRKVNFSFDFLDQGTTYTAHIYQDAADADENPQHVNIKTANVKAGDDHSATLASGGGEAIWLEAQ